MLGDLETAALVGCNGSIIGRVRRAHAWLTAPAGPDRVWLRTARQLTGTWAATEQHARPQS